MIGPIKMGCPNDCRYRGKNYDTGELEYCNFNFKEPCKYMQNWIIKTLKNDE